MDPVLIYTDTKKINDEKAVLNNSVVLFQAVYDAFVNLNNPNGLAGDPTFYVTLPQIKQLVDNTISGKVTGDFVKDFVLDYIFAQGYNIEIAGLPLDQYQVRNLIQVPDLTAIKAALQTAFGVYTESTRGTDISKLQLDQYVISKIYTADAEITAKYTYYTQSDASATLATKLIAVCAALNTFEGYYPAFYAASLGLTSASYSASDTSNGNSPLKGIDYIGGVWCVSYHYIQKFERTGSLNFGA